MNHYQRILNHNHCQPSSLPSCYLNSVAGTNQDQHQSAHKTIGREPTKSLSPGVRNSGHVWVDLHYIGGNSLRHVGCDLFSPEKLPKTSNVILLNQPQPLKFQGKEVATYRYQHVMTIHCSGSHSEPTAMMAQACHTATATDSTGSLSVFGLSVPAGDNHPPVEPIHRWFWPMSSVIYRHRSSKPFRSFGSS